MKLAGRTALGTGARSRLVPALGVPDYVIEDAVQPRPSDPPAQVYVTLPDRTVLTAG